MCVCAWLYSDYGYYREAGSSNCVKDATKPPDLCLHGDTETLKANLGYAVC